MGRLDLKQAKAAIQLMRVPGVGAAMFRLLIEHFKTPLVAFAATQSGAAKDAGFPVPRPTAKRQPAQLLENVLAWLPIMPSRHDLIWLGHPKYPPLLAQAPEPPPVLFCRGRPRVLQQKTLAIVGAREATHTGRAFASAIASWAATHGLTVVSGGARGIDAEAHRACLEHGGQTIAAIATGIDIAYPREHAALFDEISHAGCLLTEFFPGTPPAASHFPTRNRIIAGLAQATIFIEGTVRSGGLITVRKALQAERPVWAARNSNLLEGAAPELERNLSAGQFFSDPDDLFPILQNFFKPR